MWPIEEDTTHPVLRNKTSESHTSTTNVQINFEIQILGAAFGWGWGVLGGNKKERPQAVVLAVLVVIRVRSQKNFIVSCATDSYEMCFCGTVPQSVVHFDLSGSKCGTKTACFYRS